MCTTYDLVNGIEPTAYLAILLANSQHTTHKQALGRPAAAIMPCEKLQNTMHSFLMYLLFTPTQATQRIQVFDSCVRLAACATTLFLTNPCDKCKVTDSFLSYSACQAEMMLNISVDRGAHTSLCAALDRGAHIFQVTK